MKKPIFKEYFTKEILFPPEENDVFVGHYGRYYAGIMLNQILIFVCDIIKWAFKSRKIS